MQIFPECWQSWTEQAFQAFALTPKPPPSPSPQGFLASLAARSSAPAVRKHWLSLAARPRLVTGQRRSEGHFSVTLLNNLFSSRLRMGLELSLRLGETLGPFHFLTWRIPNHMSRAFHGVWGVSPDRRGSAEPRKQVSRASALSWHWGGPAVRREGWNPSEIL